MTSSAVLNADCTAATESLFQAVALLAALARKLPGTQQLVLLDETGAAFGTVPAATAGMIERTFQDAGAGHVRVVRKPVVSLSSFESLLSKRVSGALSYRYDCFETERDSQRAILALQQFDFVPPLRRGRHQLLERTDGVQLSTYAAMRPHEPAVVLVLPCGMPFQLCRPWFDLLSEDYSVVTWETRGLFGEVAEFDRSGLDLDSQLADLFGLLDHHQISRAHVMGLCGGAVIAMRAVERQPNRFSSMSLWYGDYHVADSRLRTHHQKNFDWLMSEAAQSRAQALDLHPMFLDPSILSTVPDRIAHWVLYPYANPELLYRYAKLNAYLNDEDVTASLPVLALPTLVVAGDSDETTHSGASEFVAAGLPRARFEMERNGNHQNLFSAPGMSRAMALRFIAEYA